MRAVEDGPHPAEGDPNPRPPPLGDLGPQCPQEGFNVMPVDVGWCLGITNAAWQGM
jgi:hypothetical protein